MQGSSAVHRAQWVFLISLFDSNTNEKLFREINMFTKHAAPNTDASSEDLYAFIFITKFLSFISNTTQQ